MTIETSIYAYARQSVERFPDKIAIWYNDEGITYQELFEKIDNVANHLYSIGVRKGSVVTINFPNCPQTIIAIYAVAKLGGICCMMHPLTPPSTFDGYLEHVGSKIFLTQSDFVSDHAVVINLSKFDELIKAASKVLSIVPIQEELADECSIYMSSTGTVGTPKIVMLSHKAMNAYPQDMAPHFYNHLENMVGLSIAPFYHTFGLSGDVHRTISTGSQMVILSRWNSDTAIKLISKYHINLISAPPKVYYDLLSNPLFFGNAIKQIQYCFLGGDNIPQNLIDDIDYRVGNGRVAFPVYGMTELGAGVCALTKRYDRRGSCGYPILNSIVRVRTNDGILSSFGDGELYATSENMMMGYLNDDSANRKIFYYEDGHIWIRTGDYGRVDKDGYVYFICRIKNIIIHNGYNIFPGEIESVILKVPGIEEACVFGKENKYGSEDIFAAIVIQPEINTECTKKLVMKEFEEKLPKYAVPMKLLNMDKLPRNMLNKIDIEALKKMV